MFEAIQSLPIYAIYFIIVFLILVSFEIGFRISYHLHGKSDLVESKTLGQISAALLGMLAFVLAFTFSMAASQNNKRKEMVLVEANALGTAYLRADLVDEIHGKELKQLLSEYVNMRLEAIDKEKRARSLERSKEIHRLLWKEVRLAAQANPNTNTSLLVQSINEVIDVHEKRVKAALRDKIPNSIWFTLIAISIIAIYTIGIESGYSGHRRLIVIIPLALAFAALIALIAELNRPQQGIYKVAQDSMISLQKSMNLD